MPFNPIAYATAVVEACVDAVAENGTPVARTAVDAAIATAVTAAIATAGNIPVVIAAVITAVTAAISAVTVNVATNAASRMFGRRMIVNLVALPPPPPITGTFSTSKIELKPMQGIGEFTLDHCIGDLVAVPVADVVHGMAPTELIPYPNTAIQSMQFVETSDEYPLLTYPTTFSWNPTTNSLWPISILNITPGIFRLLAPHQDVQFTPGSPFFFQDGQRTYYVLLKESISFAIHFHPRVCEFIKGLNRSGIPGLLTLENQRPDYSGATFWMKYLPIPPYQVSFNSVPKEDVDFEYQGAYSLYNWELFFHTPFLIAMLLSKNQRFEEAQKWFHYIFDPTATDSPARPGNPGIERFWRVKPFYDESMQGSIQTLQSLIADTSETSELKKKLPSGKPIPSSHTSSPGCALWHI